MYVPASNGTCVVIQSKGIIQNITSYDVVGGRGGGGGIVRETDPRNFISPQTMSRNVY
jgi:hypothetical protein